MARSSVKPRAACGGVVAGLPAVTRGRGLGAANSGHFRLSLRMSTDLERLLEAAVKGRPRTEVERAQRGAKADRSAALEDPPRPARPLRPRVRSRPPALEDAPAHRPPRRAPPACLQPPRICAEPGRCGCDRDGGSRISRLRALPPVAVQPWGAGVGVRTGGRLPV